MSRNSVSPQLSLTLAQAVKVTGSSKGRFRYNEERLRQLGATVNEHGWSIPVAALIEMGWLTPDSEVAVELSPLQRAEARVRELEAEVEAMRARQGGSLRRLFGAR